MKNAPIILILSIFLLSSCKKEPILTPTTPPIFVEETATDRAIPFDFMILKNQCLMGGSNFSVHIENPQLYGFLWEINDNKRGHLQQLEGCHCGTSAKVHITRFSDGVRISKLITLPACESATTAILETEKTENSIQSNTPHLPLRTNS